MPKVPYAADELANSASCSAKFVLLGTFDNDNLVMMVGFSSCSEKTLCAAAFARVTSGARLKS
jgi:hypothetical protein